MRRIFLCLIIFILIQPPAGHAQTQSEAQKWWQAGEKAYQSGRYREALGHYEKSYTLCRNDSECEAANLNGIGTCYEALGDDSRALYYYEKALTAARKAFNKDLLATVLFNVGATSYRLARDYERAVRLLEESIRLFRELNDRNSLGIALHVLGKVYSTLGYYEQALNSLNDTLKLAREVKNTQAIGSNLTLIGRTYYRMGNYEKAISHYEEAIEYLKQARDLQGISITLRDLGDAYSGLFKNDRALAHYEEALEIQKKNNFQGELVITLNNLGSFYSDLNEYEKALFYFEAALKEGQRQNDKALLATIYNNMGHAYAKLGLSDRAISFYRRSLALEREIKRPTSLAYVLNNIGMEYFRLEKYEEALRYLREAYEIDKKLNNPHLMEIRLNNIGAVYLRQHRFREAEEAFLERKKLEPRIRPNRLLHTGLAELYLTTGRYDEALKLIQELPPTWRDNRNRHLEYHIQLGLAYKGKGALKEAARHLVTAVNLMEEMRNTLTEKFTFFAGGSYYGRLIPYRALVSVLAEMAEKRLDLPPAFQSYGQNPIEAAFYFSELLRARNLLEAMAGAAKKSHPAELPEHLKRREEEIKKELSQLERSRGEALKKGERAVAELEKSRQRLKGELEKLVAEFRARFPRYAALHYPVPAKISDLPLKENEVLLEYTITEGGIYLFMLRKGHQPKLLSLPGAGETIEGEVRSFIAPLNEKKLDSFSFAMAHRLYVRLFSHIVQEIRTDDRLIIVPDGILGLLPFEALVIEQGRDLKEHLYVADRYSISYYPSATILALKRLSEPILPEEPLFALGNPIYSSEDPRYLAWLGKGTVPTSDPKRFAFRGLAVKEAWGKVEKEGKGAEIEFLPLPETEEEVREIAKIMGVAPSPPHVLLSVAASEYNVKRAPLERYRFIHFATHASLPGMIQGVGEPFILLGQVENKGEDGFLTLSEVAAMSIRAEMVVLSACVTGRGREVQGEGVVNFARAFQQAGAQSVVVSLWEVASEPAVSFMKSFYQHLKRGTPRAKALNLARQEMKVSFPHPFYWAVFILHGEG